MKNLLFISLLTSIVISQQITSYSWEDGIGTILGSYGNLTEPENVGTTSGISPYDGSRMLTVSESPIDGTPQAFIAWVTEISSGDEITACFYGYDNTPNSAPSLRVWGSWTANDDINSYQGSADGNTDYTDGYGWDQICHTFSTTQENVISNQLENVSVKEKDIQVENSSGTRIYRVFVLVEYDENAANEKILAQIKADQELYDAIKAADLVDEMEKKVEAYRQRKE